jgi:hypothetical protein
MTFFWNQNGLKYECTPTTFSSVMTVGRAMPRPTDFVTPVAARCGASVQAVVAPTEI